MHISVPPHPVISFLQNVQNMFNPLPPNGKTLSQELNALIGHIGTLCPTMPCPV